MAELIGRLLENDVDAFAPFKERGLVEAAVRPDGTPVYHPPARGERAGRGPVRRGKIDARHRARRRHDRGRFPGGRVRSRRRLFRPAAAVALGDAKSPPRLPEMLKALDRPQESSPSTCSPSASRTPGRVRGLRRGLRRAAGEPAIRTGCWWTRLTTCCPPNGTSAPAAAPRGMPAVLVTVDPAAVAAHALERVNDVFAVGTRPAETILAFCRALWGRADRASVRPRGHGKTLFWRRYPASPRNSSSRALPPPSRSATPASTPRANSARTRALFPRPGQAR